MNKLLTVSGVKLAEMIRKREVSSSEVVAAHISQIQKVNPVVNAVVKDRFDEARKEAMVADEALKTVPAEKLPPFHGVPCTIKEEFALKGMPNTSGLPARKGIIADFDAEGVARFKKAGAIPLGVTNTSELCMWYESSNLVYGRSNNPYNPRHIVGGSSGGEGAIIAAAGSPFGLGADVGGSIRMPAFFNGVFGHKPTGGLIPNTGQYPMVTPDAARFLVTGPLARKAEDLWPLVKILAGPDGKDPGCVDFKLSDPASVKLEGLTVIDIEDNGKSKVHPDLRAAQQKAADFLASKGAKVKKAKPEALKYQFDIWSAMLTTANTVHFSVLLGNGKAVNGPWELLKWIFQASDHTLPSIVMAMIERIPEWTPARTAAMIEKGKALRKELVDLIGPNGVMLYPSHQYPAPVHNRPLLTPFHFAYTGILNVMELPVTQVPLGLNSHGLPTGVQVVSIHGNDHIPVAVALELEKQFGGWIPPQIARNE
jgi:fatty acid amide hydrolase 2